MNRERMTILRDHLRDNVKDEKFNLATWAGNDNCPWAGKQDLSCGTTACAMGHAVTIPSFQELGLRLEPFQSKYATQFGRIAFDGKFDFDAAAAFMDISLEEAEYLFDPGQYPNDEDTSRLEVVGRLTEVLEAPSETHYGMLSWEESYDVDD